MIHVFVYPISDSLKDVIEEAADEATLVDRPGAGPGSLTDEGLRYFVTGGELIGERFRAIEEWVDEVMPLCSALAGEQLVLSNFKASAINVNVLQGEATSYELHTDPNPWTLLLMASGPHAGGELEVRCDSAESVIVAPSPGVCVLFNGDMHPHTVRPLTDGGVRISLPIVFFGEGDVQERPEGLDSHVYATERS